VHWALPAQSSLTQLEPSQHAMPSSEVPIALAPHASPTKAHGGEGGGPGGGGEGGGLGGGGSGGGGSGAGGGVGGLGGGVGAE